MSPFAAQPPSELELESVLGAQVQLVTTHGEIIHGELFCVDIMGSNSLVIRRRTHIINGLTHYEWMKNSIAREVTFLTGPLAALEALPHVCIGAQGRHCKLKMEKRLHRQNKAIRRHEELRAFQ